MIGFYDYTVVLTYLSLLSGMLGIIVSLHGQGHPYIGVFFLLFCGLCDTFDGKVASTKKDRTAQECSFGIQIDSLADLVSFGVLPGCIGIAMLHAGKRYTDIPNLLISRGQLRIYPILLFLSVLFYVTAALIRLAYFNVLEIERQQSAPDAEKVYIGLPVTMAALIFPGIMLLNFLIPKDFTIVYFVTLSITGILFLCKFRIRKPGWKGISVLLGIGLVEFVLVLVLRFFMHLH